MIKRTNYSTARLPGLPSPTPFATQVNEEEIEGNDYHHQDGRSNGHALSSKQIRMVPMTPNEGIRNIRYYSGNGFNGNRVWKMTSKNRSRSKVTEPDGEILLLTK